MNKKYLYLIISLLLCISVFLTYNLTLASPAIPNPGHGTSDLEGDAALNMNSNKIINLTTPTVDTDASNKGYVDAAGVTVNQAFVYPYNPQRAGDCGCPPGFSSYSNLMSNDLTHGPWGGAADAAGDDVYACMCY